MTADEMRSILTALMQAEDTDPQEAVTATGQILLQLLLATCKLNKYSPEVCKSTMDFVGKIQSGLQKVINENTPSNEEYMTFEQVQEKVKQEAKKLCKTEADRNARVNACQQIMEQDTLGFLLLSYLENGATSLCTNIKDTAIEEKVLHILRETLYGDGEKGYRIK